jgi:hypothetical protein
MSFPIKEPSGFVNPQFHFHQMKTRVQWFVSGGQTTNNHPRTNAIKCLDTDRN